VPPKATQSWIAELLGALDDKIESNGRVAALAEELLTTHGEAIGSTAMVPLEALVLCDWEMIEPRRCGSDVIDHYSIPAFDAGRVADRCRAETVMSGKFVLKEPSILVSRLNPRVPRIWYAVPADRPALCSTEFLVMRPRPALSLGDIWLACSDPYFFAEMAQRATGTSGSHQRVRPQDALSIEVLNPRQVDPAIRAEADLLIRLSHQRRQESRAPDTVS
jgi:type I restriction enzyme S subunit